MMRYARWIMAIRCHFDRREKSIVGIMGYARWVVAGLLIVISSEAFGLIIESPKEGTTVAVGETVDVSVRLDPGEVCEEVHLGRFQWNPLTGRYEGREQIPLDTTLGKQKFMILGRPWTCKRAEVTLNVVLPPTTVVVGIDAAMTGRKDTILKVYRTATGELVQDKFRSTARIGVGGMYSDGVERGIVDDPQLTYTSTNEKVATVTLPSKETGVYPLVNAVGRGVANIIVRYGSFENTLTVDVWECPYETRDEVPSKRGDCKR